MDAEGAADCGGGPDGRWRASFGSRPRAIALWSTGPAAAHSPREARCCRVPTSAWREARALAHPATASDRCDRACRRTAPRAHRASVLRPVRSLRGTERYASGRLPVPGVEASGVRPVLRRAPRRRGRDVRRELMGRRLRGTARRSLVERESGDEYDRLSGVGAPASRDWDGDGRVGAGSDDIDRGSRAGAG